MGIGITILLIFSFGGALTATRSERLNQELFHLLPWQAGKALFGPMRGFLLSSLRRPGSGPTRTA